MPEPDANDTSSDPIASHGDTRNAPVVSHGDAASDPIVSHGDSRNAPAPTVSFVVPAYNEARLIAGTINALWAAGRAVASRHPGETCEVVVADDASDDDTGRIALERGAVVVATSNRQISKTRNAGARAARGSLLIFVDADTVVPPETAVAAVGAVRSRGIVAGGCVCTFDEPRPRWVRVIEPGVMWLYSRARLTPGAFLFCTREAFDAVGGFDESVFGGEEVYMARALDRYARSRAPASRFTILPQKIVTSGRKLRTYSPWELMKVLATVARHRARRREGMELWYGPRREEGTRDRGPGTGEDPEPSPRVGGR